MKIVLAEVQHLESVLHNLKAANQKLLREGIHQWDERYPSRELLTQDIFNKAMFVGLEADNVIASVSIDTKQPSAYSSIAWHPRTSNPLLIHRLCVTPNHQGQGIGRKVLDFVEVYAVEKGHDSIRVDVHSGNPAALATYKNRGFTRLGELFFPRRELSFVCMQKVLV